MNAREIMTTNLITVTPQTAVEEIAKLLIDRRISAVPVTEPDGRIVGIVSEGDLMRRPEGGTEPRHSWWLDLVGSPDDRAREYLRSHGLKAADVMTREVVSVGPETSVGEIAELLERRHIKRVPVVENGKAVGIVSRANLIRALATHRRAIPGEASATDAAIRDKLLAHLDEHDLPSAAWINPIVSNGIVSLWGFVESERQRDAIRMAAESIDGVKSVDNHLGILTGMARTVMWAE